MGQRVKVELFDDIDGTDATKTAEFGWGGRSYEIDLNDRNYQKLEKALADFVSHARYAGKSGGKKLHQVKTGPDPRAVRQWAASNGIEVNRLGKVPQDVIDKYHAAGN